MPYFSYKTSNVYHFLLVSHLKSEENAFNEVSDKCLIYPFDVKDKLCNEIDNPEDLENVKKRI